MSAPPEFEASPLWRTTLGRQDDDELGAERERLRSSFLAFRKKSSQLAGEISLSAPSLTVHDISHIDALWTVASDLIGGGLTVNAAEAFVLGGAFLVHDLANGAAAYEGGESELRSRPEWRDVLGLRLRRILERPPKPDELDHPSEDDASFATSATLRLLHARRAEELALATWSDGRSDFHLIEDEDVRRQFGAIIGAVAASHWWDVADLERRLSELLAPPSWLPRTWVVNPRKLSVILRVADAAHLDQRRAPPFLMALRKPSESSRPHWVFQGKLSRPTVRGGELLFTSGSSFDETERDAWWLCHDHLRMLDSELRDANALLKQHGLGMLAVSGVRDIESPEKLARGIPCSGWHPVDARVHMSDTMRIVRTLGGQSLYGDRPEVPLRELLQNAADAVRARRVIEGLPDSSGTITVRSFSNNGTFFLEIQDDGVGMSRAVLLGAFLGFCDSLWNSDAVHREFPGLASSHFNPTGRFGIGIFSIFMLSERVTISTRRYDASHDAGLVLEFGPELESRPYLRPARDDEKLSSGGTRVTVELGTTPYAEAFNTNSSIGLLERGLHGDPMWFASIMLGRLGGRGTSTLSRIVRLVAPTLDVRIHVREEAGDGVAMDELPPNEWRSTEPKLLGAVTGELPSKSTENMAFIGPEDSPLGRCALEPNGMGIITVGGFRARSVAGINGLILGKATTASRSDAIPLANPAHFSAWATKQAEKLSDRPHTEQQEAFALVSLFGGHPSGLTFAKHEDRYLTYSSLILAAADWEDFIVSNVPIYDGEDDWIPRNRIVAPTDIRHPFARGGKHSTSEVFIAIAAAAWGVKEDEVRDSSDIDRTCIFLTEDSSGTDSEDFDYHLIRRRKSDE